MPTDHTANGLLGTGRDSVQSMMKVEIYLVFLNLYLNKENCANAVPKYKNDIIKNKILSLKSLQELKIDMKKCFSSC